jgi:flagellar FliL protein
MAKEKPAKEKPADAEDADATEGEGAEGGAKKKPPLMLLIGGGVGALVIVILIVVVVMMMLGGKGGGDKKAEHKPAHKPPAKAEAKKGGKDAVNPISQGPDGVIFYTMPDMVVNLQSGDGRPTFLKLKLAFEVPDQDSADAIEPNQLRLNDMFQGFLRELRPEDLSGSQGSYQLRMEIQRRVNLVIAPAKVNAVLIQEMLIQ